jgi:hypothetical protein
VRLDPSPITSLNQSAIEDESNEVSQAHRTGCEQCDSQSITVDLEPLRRRRLLSAVLWG